MKFLVREATRLQPGRPALRMGLRAALAVIAPMVLAAQLGALVMTWATLGGFSVVLVDKGGAYRTRATAMISATAFGAFGALVGSLAANASSAAVPVVVIAVGTAACAMTATWAGPAVAVGNTIAVQLIVATTLPNDPARPWVPALGILAGGGWSLVLALLLWPVRVYRPARQAARTCIRDVASHAAYIAARDEADADTWREAIIRRHRTTRDTLEAAREVLAATRRGRRREIGRGERLLVIVEVVDQIFGVLLGTEEVIDNLSSVARDAVTDDLRAGLTAAVDRLYELADRVVIEVALPALPAIAWTADDARSRTAALPPLAHAEVDHALSLVTQIHDSIAALTSVVESLTHEREAAPVAPLPEDPAASITEALRGSLDPDSAVLRHAIRVGLVASLSLLVTQALDLQRGYWATLTAVLLLQPYLPATITRGLQRVGGTVAGAVLATAIAAAIHDPLGIAIAAIVFAGVSAALLQLNYGLYALFLTPTFVLLAEVHARDTHLAALRITNTLLGAGLAVLGALLLWPSRESTRTGDRLAAALTGVAGYVDEVFAVVANREVGPASPVTAARRAAGRAFNNADLSLDRLVAEGPPAAILEPQMAVATLVRRLAATLSALATARGVSDPSETTACLTAIGVDAASYLRGAAIALRDGTPPPSYKRHDAAAHGLPALLASRVARIDLQISIIAEAVARTVAVTRSRPARPARPARPDPTTA